MRRSLLLRSLTLVALFPGLLLWTPVYSNPTGGVVVHGDISMNGGAGNLTITQNSQNAILNWNDFSIDAGELTQFIQPGSSAAVLNRVTGGNPSAIHGALQANGSVFVINPNGIMVGPTGTIDVHGLVLSTLDVSDGEFLAGGDMVFKGSSDSGVTNMGRINGIGGDVFLIGKTVTNTGSITASSGTVGLGAGEEVLLTAPDGSMGERMFIRSTGSGASGTGVLNDGTIEGAAVELKAHGNMYALAINNKGSVRATGVDSDGGRVFLRGVGGLVENSGSIEATSSAAGDSAKILIEAAYARAGGFMSANGAEGGEILISASQTVDLEGTLEAIGSSGAGGRVVVEGEAIELGSTSSINASGASGGGTINVGGGFQGRDSEIRNATMLTAGVGSELLADAIDSGDGGSVILWSDDETVFEGSISAQALGSSGDGGFVEVSGKNLLTFDGVVSTLSNNGSNGTLLLDPTDLTISNGSGANIVNVGNLVTALGFNNVVIATDGAGTQDGDIRINDNVDYTSSNSLTLLANGDIEATRRLQNQGTGDVNLVAGWDGVTGFTSTAPGTPETGAVNMTDFFSDSSSYGQAKLNGGNGSLLVFGTSNQRVALGSRFGDTNVAAHGVQLAMDGWNGAAQIGINDRDGNVAGVAADGNIRVDVHDSIVGTSLNGYAGFSNIQIGHGGAANDNGPGSGNLTGDITVNAGVDGLGSGDISFISNVSGDTERFYMQIGHGGRRVHGAHSGAITVDTRSGTSGDITFEAGQAATQYVMIGHGGENLGNTNDGTSNNTGPVNQSGNITVLAGGDITFRGGEARGSAPNDAWRNATDAFAQLGHGGRNSDGSHSGAIVVEAGGDLLFQSGDNIRDYAQLGHGGHAADGDHSGTINLDIAGTITFDARGRGGSALGFGGVDLNRNETYVQLGHGGYAARGSHSQDITVESGGDISFFGGVETTAGQSGYRSYAQLGHGGLDADTPNDDVNRIGNSGNITIISGGALNFQAADADEAYVLLGHGGLGTRGIDSGNIDITTAGNIDFTAGERIAFAQLGHGSYEADGNKSGNINIDAGGDVTFQGGLGTQARDIRASAQLGHGGFSTVGVHSGDIVLNADGFIRFAAGQLTDNYAQLGHGGRNARSGSNTSGFSGDIDVSAGTGISFIAGTMLSRTTANGFVGQDIIDNNTSGTFTQAEADTVNSDEGVFTDGRLYVMLGHGGYDADASANNERQDGVGHRGDIRVLTTSGDITFNGAGVPNQGANSSAGDGEEGRIAFAMLGHGGAATIGDHQGAIEVGAGGNVVFNGGTQTADGNINRNTGVLSTDTTDIYNYAQIGHGGVGNNWGNSSNATGRHSANSVGGTLSLTDGISVTAGNAVAFNAGLGRRSYAQLGLGGFEARGVQDGLLDHTGDITVSAGAGGVNFLGGINEFGSFVGTNTNDHGRESYAQLGHGGFEADGTYSGAISVTTTDGGAVRFISGTRTDNYTQLGHGGRSAQSGGAGVAGGNKGDITVNADGDVDFVAGTLLITTDANDDARIYTQLGHGGYESDAFVGGTLIAGSGHEGDITVNAGGNLNLIGGNTANGSLGNGGGRFHSAQIGHGGYNAGGEHKGSVNVDAAGQVQILGGSSNDNSRDSHNFALVGHGGRGYTWGTDVNGGALDSTSLSGNTDGVNVSAGAGLSLIGGDHRSFAQIGLGGAEYDGDHTGNVSAITTGGNLVIAAGFEDLANAMIGNGGRDVDGVLSGDIRVTSAGSLTATGGSGVSESWGGTNIGHESAAQIGHGGHEADGDKSGNIIVRVTEQFEIIAGENGAYRNYAQIGHGGTFSNGVGSGLISVSGGSGTSRLIASQSLSGGPASDSYAQIGHGGHDADNGNKSGNIEVIITDGGNLDMVSGSNGAGGNSYAMIGHGGTGMEATDEVSGSITALIDGELSIVRNDAQTQIAHRGGLLTRQPGDLDSDLTVIAGSIDNAVGVTNDLIRITNDTAEGQIQNIWISPYLNGNIGNVTFGTDGTGSVDWSDTDYDYTSTKNFTLTSGSDLFFMKRIRNREQTDGGDINVLGNWGGSVGQVQFNLANDEAVSAGFNMAAVLTDADSAAPTWAGSNSGNVVVGQDFAGAGNNGTVSIGSRTGDTSVLGHDVLVIAGGDEGGNGRSAQIGVRDNESGASHTGNINVFAMQDVVVAAGTAGGPGQESGTQQAFGMIGHGGMWQDARLPEVSGDIRVDAGRNVTATAGSNESNFVKIGHGGVIGYDTNDIASDPTRAPGKLFGDIDVDARTGDVSFAGGTGLRSFAQLGHGGRDYDPSLMDSSNPNESSNISVDAGGDITFRGGSGAGTPVSQRPTESWAMLGNGGYQSEVRAAGEGWYGDITVNSGGTIDFRAGDARDNFVMLGNGGRNSKAGVNGGHSGDILVSAATGVNFIGGVINSPINGEPAGEDGLLFAQLGHGGWDGDVNFSNDPVAGVGHTGDIRVITTNGDINFLGAATDRTGDLAQFNGVGTTVRHGYSQLGHGGMEAKGEHSGAIEVEATNGDVNVLAGTQDDPDSTDEIHYAQIGHGGAAFNWGGGAENIPLSANSVSATSGVADGLRVTAGGDVNVGASDIGRSYAMIGLGGWGNDGDHVGDISVTSNGDILLRGGNSFENFAQIGHGGRGAAGNQGGDIEITGTGRLDVLAGSGTDSYAMVGHGGTFNAQMDGNRSGDIFVSFAEGIAINAGVNGGVRALSQIGHGGYNANGDHSGFVTVINSTSGDILLRGGDGANDKSAQIGHRGDNSLSSNLSGSISVVNLGGDITLQAGNNNWRGAIIGHGDAQQGITGGQRTGGLNVFASGAITLTDGVNNSGAYIGHQTNSGIGAVSYAGSGINAAGDSGFSIVAGNGFTAGADQINGTGNAISMGESIGAALAVGNVTIASGGTGDLDLNAIDAAAGGAIASAVGTFNSANDVTFAAGGDLLIGFGLQNEGTGDVNLVAGWSGAIGNAFIQAPEMDALTTNPFFNDATLALGDIAIPDFEQAIPLPLSCLEFGLNGGDIVLGSTGQTSRFSVGSRQGTTNVLGNAVSLFASDGTTNAGTQIGFFMNGSGDASGAINVGVGAGGLLLDSGNAGGAFTQIGHGGFLATAGNTTADADITISFCEPGDLTLLGGGSDAFAQIGNGGFNGAGNMDGDITVGMAGEEAGAVTLTGGTGATAYAQIGHGGSGTDGTKTGNISVEATNGVTMTTSDTGARADTYIGHGGRNTDGAVTGNIEVTSIGGDIRINGGGAFDSTATIGHSGQNTTGNKTGNISVTAEGGSVAILGGAGQNAVGSIGHGGSWRSGRAADILSGSIEVSASENVSLTGSTVPGQGSSQDGGALIGHGGGDNDAAKNGTITVTADSDLNGSGDVSLTGGSKTRTYAKIGHAGATGSNGATDGAVTVSGVNVALTAGSGLQAFAMIGNGGLNNDANHAGDITVTSTGNLSLTGDGTNAFAQIGNGGAESAGVKSGAITINADGDIAMRSGIAGAYTQIGHGGATSDGGIGAGSTININQATATPGALSIAAGTGDRAYAQIGHGGYLSSGGVLAADINIDAASVNTNDSPGGGVAGGTAATGFATYVQIGHGGFNETEDAGALRSDWAAGTRSGDINLEVTGNVDFVGGSGIGAYTQVGHGGRRNHAVIGEGHSGTITLNADEIDFFGGSGAEAFVMLGHGGFQTTGDHQGDITVTGDGLVRLRGDFSGDDDADRAFAQFGHGGYDSDFNTSLDFSQPYYLDNQAATLRGNIAVSSANSNVVVRAIESANAQEGYAQIGHGGFDTTGNFGDASEAITVTAANGAIVVVGNDSNSPTNFSARGGYAQIGHGGAVNVSSATPENGNVGDPNAGVAAAGEHAGDIILSSSSLNVDAGRDDESYAQVGHGGFNNGMIGGAGHRGDISVTTTGGEVRMQAGPGGGFASYSMIGHGGNNSNGDHQGGITVSSADNVRLLSGGATRAFNQIGHGGFQSAGNFGTATDDLIVTAAGNIELQGGVGNGFALIGHGGHDSDGDHAVRNLNVTSTGGAISLTGAFGTGNDAFAQIGLGGRLSDGARSASAINVVADGDITMNGSLGVRSGTQIGNGGDQTVGAMSGNISVTSNSGRILLDGNPASGDRGGARSGATIGHGGFDADGTKDGDITVASASNGAGEGVILNAGGNNGGAARIGHGGQAAEGSIGSLASSNVSVTSGGSIELRGNQNVGGNAATQIGHGGIDSGAAGNTITGTVSVTNTSGDILVSGSRGGTGISYTQIGHGGINSVYDIGGAAIADQDLTVNAAAGAITLTGSGSQNHVMIGHGGENHTGDARGNIDVFAANAITMTGGGNLNSATQIGHGGMRDTALTGRVLAGDIDVRSETGSVSLSTVGGGNQNGIAVQIGHGGYNTVSGSDATIDGKICVVAGTTAEINASGGGNEGSYAMIGHGGVRLAGDFTGDITVTTGTSGTGGITLTGGDDVADGNEFAQIGHGGIESNGILSGDVYAIADSGGDITLTGGTGNASNYAMIGHGDGEGTTSQGQREGGIHIFAENSLTATNGAGLENVNVWHQTNGGLVAADYLGGDGFQIFQDLNGLAASAVDPTELVVMAEGNFGAGSVNIITSADTDIVFDGGGSGDILVNSSDDFFFVTGGSITFENSYQNAGTGNVTIVAGWNGQGTRPPATVEYADLGGGMFNHCEPTIRESGVVIDFNDCTTFGQDPAGDGVRGSITLGSATQDSPVFVGSRRGRTVAAGYGLTLNGGDTAGAATQLGFHNGSVPGATGSASGVIDVFVHGGGVTLNSGSAAGTYTQIGHGGNGAVDGIINAAMNISFCEPATIDLNGGSDLGAYAQIGHGIVGGSAALSGAIDIDGFSDLTMDGGSSDGTFAQIGHGGALSSAAVANSGLTLNGGAITAGGGAGNGAYVMIGHGGLNETRDAAGTAVRTGYAEATRSGAIDIDLTGDFDFTGGAGAAAFAHIGHGGRRNNAVDGEGHNGDIEIDANTIDVIGGPGAESYAMVGHGGYQTTGNHSGDIALSSTGNVWIRGDVGGNDDADRAFAMVGHGGYDADFNTADLIVAPDINLLPYYVDNRAATLSGSISVTSTSGDIQVRGAQSNSAHEAFGQLGHGGFDTTGSFGDSDDTITVTASTGQVSVFGGLVGAASDLSGRGNYGQIGMGGAVNISTSTAFNGGIDDPNLGLAAAGSHQGDITVLSGRTVVNAGIDNESYAQIGHGGINSGAGGGHTGDISVTGVRAGDGDVVVRGGAGGGFAAHAQIGHGGRNSDGDHNGSILVDADRDINMDRSGASAAFLLIGHGGHSVEGTLGSATDTIVATAGRNVSVRAGGSESFAMIGLGGFNVDGDKTLDSLTVNSGTGAGTGRMWLQGGNGNNDRFAMIGMGGRNSNGSNTINDLTVNADGALDMQSGIATNTNAGIRGFTMIGLGGNNSSEVGGTMTINNDLNVTATNDITMTAGGNEAFSMIGVGGFNSNADLSVNDINVTSTTGAVSLLAGTVLTDGTIVTTVHDDAFAQIGVGGRATEGAKSANSINVTANGTDADGFGVSVISGPVVRNYAQIGVGGHQAHTTGAVDATVNVTSNGGGVRVVASDLDNQTYAQIGHGGRFDRNAGAYELGALSGDITVNAAGASSDVVIDGGGGTSYAQIGHGGYEAGRTGDGADHSGSIDVDAGRDLLITGGQVVAPANSNGFAMLGHGGTQSDGNHSGNISVDVARDITLQGGGDLADLDRNNQQAQIGHGGNGVDGTLDGDIFINQNGGAGAGAITLNGGVSSDSYAQIGHGGASHDGAIGSLASSVIRMNTVGALSLNGGSAGGAFAQVGHGGLNHTGSIGSFAAADIILDIAGATTLTGGSAGNTFARIGHGGANQIGAIDGAITLTNTSGLTLQGGSSTAAAVQIGQGGFNHSGAIGSLFDSSVAVTTTGAASITGGTAQDAFAHIGHLGSDADGDVTNSNVTLNAGAGVDLNGGDIQESYAQIGHGGDNTDAGGTGMSGNVTVTTTTGDISLRSNPNSVAGGNRTSAQIGHGGLNNNDATGDFTGAILVEATAGSVGLFSSDAANNNITQIGHGGLSATAANAHSGDITVTAGTDISVNGGNEGVGGTRPAMIGHGGQGSQGDHNGDITLTAGGNVDILAGTLDLAFAQVGHGGNNGDGALSGDISITANGAGSALQVLGGGVTETPNNSYAQVGHGGLNADGTKDGTITINVTNAATIAGRLGQIAYGQIGHGGHNSSGSIGTLADSAISLTAGSIDLAGNQGAANTAYTQLGHGGWGLVSAGSLINGDITATATTGDILLTGSNSGSANSYVVLGHAGQNSGYSADADITVEAQAGAITIQGSAAQATTQIGHGGELSTGDFAGDISVEAANAISLTGGSNADAETRIGHGGNASTGTADGNIAVTSDTGDISLTGGSANEQVGAQIGHGGAESTGNLGSTAGNITVAATAGNVILQGGPAGTGASAQIGHGGLASTGSKDGDISVSGAGTLSMQSTGSGGSNYAQIGHGGRDSSGVIGAVTGDIDVTFTGDINVTGNQAGTATSGTQIGHGGYQAGVLGQSIAGAIAVNSTGGSVIVTGSNGGSALSFTQIGHAGQLSNYDVTDSLIDIDAGGAVTIIGSGAQNSTMIGHGGEDARGAGYAGAIDVLAAGPITLTGGGNLGASAQIGHGGGSDLGDPADGGAVANLSGQIDVVSTGGDIQVTGGTNQDDTYAMIGHGGTSHTGDKSGAINVAANNGSILVEGGEGIGDNDEYNSGQIGHGGGRSSGNIDGNINVSAQSITVQGPQVGNANNAYGQIGHGGGEAGFAGDTIAGSIDLTATTGDLLIRGGINGTGLAHAQVGHGGELSNYTVTNQPITINVMLGAITLDGSDAQSHVMIGHGGEDSTGDGSGDISITAQTGLTMAGADNFESVTQIGHGGIDSTGAAAGDILIEVATGDLSMLTASNTSSYVNVGHGGRRSSGASLTGDIEIALGAGSLLMNADGGGNHSYAQIGHGGTDSTVAMIDGHICIDISTAAPGANGIELTAGGDFGEFAQIGHGGLNTVVNMSGGISSVIRNGGNLSLNGGNNGGSNATIGHGDGASGTSTGTRSGQIDLIVEGDTILTDGTTGAAVLAHGTNTAAGVTGGGFSLLTNQLDTANAALSGVTGTIERMAPGGEVEIIVTGGSLDVGGPGAFYNGVGTVELVATGSLNLLSSIQNAGSGGVSLVAGWDGTSGLTQTTDFNTCPIITDLSIDVATVLSDPAQFGSGGLVNLGDGTQSVPIAVGSAGGTTTAAGAGVNLVGSDSTPGGFTQIGYNEEYSRNAGGLPNGTASSGDITVIGKTGGVVAFAGDADGASAQIGHGGSSNSSASFGGDITVTSDSLVSVVAGDGTQSFAHIGHGGAFSNGTNVTGDVNVAAADDINVISGQGDRSYAQIGSGGAAAGGTMSGDITVDAGNEIRIDGTSSFVAAHAKIGLGDDPSSGLTGTGSRSGDIDVTAGTDITLSDAMIGHVNASKQGTNPSAGVTQIGVSRLSPTNENGGSLTLDAASELAGPDGLRVYVPERANNRIAPGALLNGVSYPGAKTDPSTTQGADEFAVRIENDEGVIVVVNQHNNLLGSGPAPVNAGSFAFYYNQIVLNELPDGIDPGGPGGGGDNGSGGGVFNPNDPNSNLPGTLIPLRDAQDAIPDDRTVDDWQREQEEQFTGFKFFEIFYEGFDQYGPKGESVYNYFSSNSLEIGAGQEDTDDVLRRQLQILEEEAERRAAE